MTNPISHRWNIEPLPDGRLKVCRGEHHRSSDCEWEYFVPEGCAIEPTASPEPEQSDFESRWTCERCGTNRIVHGLPANKSSAVTSEKP